MNRMRPYASELGIALQAQKARRAAFVISVMSLYAVVLANTTAADEPATRQAQIDPFSRNFMAPSLDDFLRPDNLGLKFEEVRFTNEVGSNLRGWFLPAQGGRYTILFCMGNTGNISGMLLYAKLLIMGGFNVFLFDYQGYGGSEGMATAMSLHGDAISAFDYLTTQRQLPPAEIGVFGVSLGSPLAIAVAAKRNAGAVAVEDILLPMSQIESMRKLLPDDFPTRLAISGIQKVVVPNMDPLQNVPRLKCPLFLMHGENDRLLPPSGTVQIAALSKVPTRTWIMAGAGHAPETLEVNELEYATQIPEFFKAAFAETLTVPKSTMDAESRGEKWIARVTLECPEPGAWQVAIGSPDGRFVFVRRVVNDQITFSTECDFEPNHVSAIRFHHFEPQNDGSWLPKLSRLSQALVTFRTFERQLNENCPLINRAVAVGSREFSNRGRDPTGMAWLLANLPKAADVHEHVRPRYARAISAFYCSLNADGQLKCRDLLPTICSFLPTEPEHYYQLDNAGFMVRLEDPRLTLCLTHLAKGLFADKQLAEAKDLLRMAQRVSPPGHRLRALDIEALEVDSEFDRFLGEAKKNVP